ncbi:MAG: imidazoleglycerol-phosphate dehydratase HisB [bacterium]|nr:imidazoleglycerol-phosphate dehydratase HisB [bacterium]
MKKRIAEIKRKTSETNIRLLLNLDGTGKYKIKTQVPFITHMLDLFSKHGRFDLEIDALGDIQLGDHHLVEDLGICLGEAVKKALGDKKGIKRYGEASVPMDETLVKVILDISGRPYLVYNVNPKNLKSIFRGIKDPEKIGKFDYRLTREFFQAFCNNAGVTLHIRLEYGDELHHIIEAIFKAFGRALGMATQKDPRIKTLPSTKGKL